MSEAVAAFHFPDDLWAHVVYDLVTAARFGGLPAERLVAALVPIYFGRVGSLIVEARRLDGPGSEERVERQAREFELAKPYLVERWQAAQAAAAGRAAQAAAEQAAQAATEEAVRPTPAPDDADGPTEPSSAGVPADDTGGSGVATPAWSLGGSADEEARR
jgi:hypothetical protein